MRKLELLHLGRVPYGQALKLQGELVDRRKRGEGSDTLIFLEHPNVITMGRNARREHLLADPQLLDRAGIELFETDRGGDVTYHGPGQVVGYLILDLREWKRDVHAYSHSVEQALIDALRTLSVQAERVELRGHQGVWVNGAKIGAIGIHISRWITSHGFALNVDTDLNYFKYIVPCGLSEPVCSLRSLGSSATRDQVIEALGQSFARVFGYEAVAAAGDDGQSDAGQRALVGVDF